MDRSWRRGAIPSPSSSDPSERAPVSLLPLPSDFTDADRRTFVAVCCWIQEHLEEPAGVSQAQLLVRAGFDPDQSYERPSLVAATLTIADLAMQGWNLTPTEEGVRVERPAIQSDREAEKARIRRQEHVRRNAQFESPSVRSFVQRMETPRLHAGRLLSVLSLMRDGRELRQAIETQASAPPISPYVQFVDSEQVCRWTGLRLMDIWRYFRLTWSNAYSSVPGRNLLLLVRDSAAVNHPVIGIAALASPIVQIADRDRWIGWDSETILERLGEEPTEVAGLWFQQRISESLDGIYVDDLLVENILTSHVMESPTAADLLALTDDAQRAKRAHQRDGSPALLRALGDDWRAKAQTPLFRAKRSEALAKLLKWRMDLAAISTEEDPKTWLVEVLGSSSGTRVLTRILRHARGERVGTVLADLSVCGAVAPYNHLAAGKLVGALAVSPTVIREYRRRYSRPSEIASSMAGRAVTREARLAFVGTTSLYGTGSSQYNRLFWPAEVVGGTAGQRIGFYPMGRSRSFGTAQFHDATVRALIRCSTLTGNSVRINHIFGEGVSPRLRKVRLGLTALGWPSDLLLKHGRERLLYGVPLVRNLPEFAIGMVQEPEPLFDLDLPGDAERIAEWWWGRWGKRRADQPRIANDLSKDHLDRPVRHGAKVPLPVPESLDASLIP